MELVRWQPEGIGGRQVVEVEPVGLAVFGGVGGCEERYMALLQEVVVTVLLWPDWLHKGCSR